MTAQTLTPVQEVSKSILSMKPDFTEILKNTGIDPDRFTRVAIMAVQQNPDLMNCTKASLYKAVTDCARSGLLPDGNEAAIVPFGKDAVCMDMIAGLMKLFRNSGECGSVDSQVVFEKDEYDSWVDEKGPHFKHRKSLEKDKGAVRLTYAYAITKDNHLYFEELTPEDMEGIKSKSRNQALWNGPFKYEMYRKSALRRLSKRLPKSTDIETALGRHDEQFDLEVEQAPEGKKEETTSSRLSNVIDAQHKVREDVPVPPPVPPPATAPADPLPPVEEPTDPPEQIQEGAQEPKTIKGLITNLKVTTAPPGTKPYWTRYGCQLQGSWYGTFDKKIYDEMTVCGDKKILVEITYTEVVKQNRIYYECKSIRKLNATDMEKSGEMPF